MGYSHPTRGVLRWVQLANIGEQTMPSTLFTGWRTVTPGACDACDACGSDDDWQVDGRGNILCSCQACVDCNELDAYGFHAAGCPQIDAYACRTCGSPVDPSATHCTDCAEDWSAIAAAIA
jgi:hypothetical protein